MRRTLIAIAGLGLASMAQAQEVSPLNVAFDEYGEIAESLTGTPGDPAAGQKVMATKSMGNCVACHQVTGLDAAFQGTVGPSLDGAGDRWELAQLRGIVADAKKTFPDTVMPGFYKVQGFIRPGNAFTGKAGTEPLPPLLNATQIEDVVAYLVTLKE